MDANITERKKRSNNLIISKVKEEKDENLKAIAFELLGKEVEKSEILEVKRLNYGRLSNRNQPRLIFVTLKYEEDARWAHRNGRGYNVEGDIWINPDLTKTERDALWEERKAKKASTSQNDRQNSASSNQTAENSKNDE